MGLLPKILAVLEKGGKNGFNGPAGRSSRLSGEYMKEGQVVCSGGIRIALKNVKN
jgi:hypothetical protein